MKSIITFLILAIFIVELQGQSTYTAVANGDWDDSSTWSPTGVPGTGDTARIKGRVVTITNSAGHIQVDSIYIDNSNGGGRGIVEVDINAQLTVRTIHLVGKDIDEHTKFKIYSGGVVNVTEDFLVVRSSDNDTEKSTKIYVDNARMDIGGDLIFNFGNSDSGTDKIFQIQDSSEVNIQGGLKLNISGGNLVKMNLKNAELNITGDLTLNSTGSNLKVRLKLLDDALLNVDGDIIFQANSDEDVEIKIFDSELKLSGAFQRPNDYGYLLVDSASMLTYDGSSPQTIASDKMPNAGVDSFSIANVNFANTSGSPMGIQGDLTVTTHLDLSNGIIQTTDSTLLIIEDGATIGIGSATAYVDGPIVKKGSTNGTSFVFPLGNEGVYAPLEISSVSNPDFEYQAQYFSDPPPIEDGISPPLEKISSSGYWTVAKSAGADDPDFSLHWTDAAAMGINVPDSLLVAGLKDNGGTKTWESYGNSSTTGGAGNGLGGSVTTALADPPPLDEVTLLTIGTINAESNALPVTLTRFGAVQIGEEVQLEWETIVEEDADRFVIERSTDGKSFVMLDEVAANGSSFSSNAYTTRDLDPSIGVNYYRLKQIDYDGLYAYSEIISIRFNSKQHSLQVYPNPIGDIVSVQGFSDKQKEILLTVEDQNGRQLFNGIVPVLNGRIQISSMQLNLDHRGVYFLQFETGNDLRTIKVIRIK